MNASPILRGLGLTVTGLLVIAVLIVIGATVYTGRILEKALQDYGSNIAGTTIRADEVDAKLWQGKAEIADLRVANPSSFSGQNMLTAEEVDLNIHLPSLLSDRVRVPLVEINSLSVYYQIRNGNSNFAVVQSNISGKEKQKGRGKQVIIEQFRITNARVGADIPGIGDRVSFTLGPIELTDVGRGDRSAGDVIIDALHQRIMERVFSDDIFDAIGDALGESDPVMNTLRKAGEQYSEEFDQGARQNANDLLDD